MEANDKDTLYVVLQDSANTESLPVYWIYISIGLIILFLILFNLKKVKGWFIKLRPTEYEVSIPGFSLKGNLRYTSIEQEVAWKIYIELITRVSGNKLENNTGILRESLNSLYFAFGALREVLKDSGAELAKGPFEKDELTLTSLLLIIMNQHLRSFLSKWHPLLQEHENRNDKGISQFKHEQNWEHNEKFRSELSHLQNGLEEYIAVLKEIAAGKKT